MTNWRGRMIVLVMAGLLLVPLTAQGDHKPEHRKTMDHHPTQIETAGSSDNRPALSKNLIEVGFLGFEPFTISDIWAHGDFVYLAGLSGSPIQVVDISDPADPQVATTIESPDPACSTQDVKVETISTSHFKGDILAVGGEGCLTGLQLWDVTDANNPVLLSAVTQGSVPEFVPEFVHNVFVFEQGRNAYVIAASSFNELFTPFGDVLIVDITDPVNPVVIAAWGAGKDGGLAFGTPLAPVPPFPPGSDCTPPPGGEELCRGLFFPAVNAHDVWVEGTTAYVSYWDAGVILLDVSDPSDPTLIGRAVEPPTFGTDEGDAHVAVPARGGNLLLVGDETVIPDPWGFVRIFDTSDPANPVQVGAYATENALNAPEGDLAGFSAHNIIVHGNRAFMSWYDDGIRVLDFSQPNYPREVAAFVPEAAASFWGIYVHRNLVLGSDFVGAGLYILKLK